MNDRMAELLEKGKNDLLSPEEKVELAGLLNMPILDGLSDPLPGFVSKYTFKPSDIAARVLAVDWFSSCGRPASFALTVGVEYVGTWAEAVKSYKSRDWENVELEAQNQLTLWLHDNDRKNYQKWNQLVDRHKTKVLNRLAAEKWVPFQEARGLGIDFVRSVQWDILGALMENSYQPSGHRCFFFLELLLVYEAGHFPCGWRGEWPRGKLVVY